MSSVSELHRIAAELIEAQRLLREVEAGSTTVKLASVLRTITSAEAQIIAAMVVPTARGAFDI